MTFVIGDGYGTSPQLVTAATATSATRARDLMSWTPGVIDVVVFTAAIEAARRGFEAVRGVSFSVRRGELFALLGTNGAGKTSLLEVVEGLAPAASGTVRVLGRDPYGIAAWCAHASGSSCRTVGFRLI